jgi:uncharacterized repeat protein (TIGR03806 family)
MPGEREITAERRVPPCAGAPGGQPAGMRWAGRASLIAGLALAGLAGLAPRAAAAAAAMAVPEQRPDAQAYLRMADEINQVLPALLSQTGAFADDAGLVPSPALIPYQINTPLWSDGAKKQRWISVPSRSPSAGGPSAVPTIAFNAEGEWRFPAGTVLVKQFSLPIDERDPSRLRRLETRLLVVLTGERVYGVSYRWRPDGSAAERCDDGAEEDIAVTMRDGQTRIQRWHFPSRGDCLQCHNQAAGGVLGVKTRQLNRMVDGTDGMPVNQLVRWRHLGLLSAAFDEARLPSYQRLVGIDDASASLEQRVRSYLDANCSHCHRPGVLPFSTYDARWDTPLDHQNLILGRVANEYGIDRARYIRPRDPWRSMVLVRQERTEVLQMPPLSRTLVDEQAVGVLRAWIDGLPGDPTLAPPEITPPPGRYQSPLEVQLRHDDAQADLRYTLDGSLPDQDSPRYAGAITLDQRAVLRVTAFRSGWSASLPVTATFDVR